MPIADAAVEIAKAYDTLQYLMGMVEVDAMERRRVQTSAGRVPVSIVGGFLGSGKTTLLRMIAGFQKPTSGDLLIKGNSVLEVPPNKRPVSMVFQHLALFPMMNIGANVGFGLRQRGVNKTDINSHRHHYLASF